MVNMINAIHNLFMRSVHSFLLNMVNQFGGDLPPAMVSLKKVFNRIKKE